MDLRFAAEEGDWGDEPDEVAAVAVVKEPQGIPPRNSMLSEPSKKDVVDVDVPARPPSKIHTDPHTRYFIVKSSSHKNIVLSIEHRVWATPRSNQEKLNEAFRSASHVILIFSVTGSGCFQGYAKMLCPVGKTNTDVFQGFGRAFEVRWLRLDDLDFESPDVRDLRNPWNDNKSVKVSRDGQELPLDVGRRLCESIDQQVYEGDPKGYVDDSQETETGDPRLKDERERHERHERHMAHSAAHMAHMPGQPHPVQPLHPMHMAPMAPMAPMAHWPMHAPPGLVPWGGHGPHGPPSPGLGPVSPSGHVPSASGHSPRKRQRREDPETPHAAVPHAAVPFSAPPSEWKGSAPRAAAPQAWLGASPR